MNVFERLSGAQQQVLLLQDANRGTCKSLARAGLITFSESVDGRTVELTDLSSMVLFAHGLRDATTARFQPGEQVVALDFAWRNGALEFVGRGYRVYSVGGRFVTITDGIGLDRRNPFNLAHVFDIKRAGLIGLVRRDPLETQL